MLHAILARLQQTAAPQTITVEYDDGKPAQIDFVKEAESILKKDLANGKRMINKDQLWRLVDSNFRYIKQTPNNSKAKERSELTEKVVDYILDFYKKNKKAKASSEETAEPIKLKPWQMKIYKEIKGLTLRLRVLPETNADNLVVITDSVTCVPYTLLALMKQETIVCKAEAESSSVIKITYTKLSRFGQ